MEWSHQAQPPAGRPVAGQATFSRVGECTTLTRQDRAIDRRMAVCPRSDLQHARRPLNAAAPAVEHVRVEHGGSSFECPGSTYEGAEPNR